ncbi:MAG TPA: hypothetical protein VK445_02105 [Dissulfurispiraceae bacterium]|nr:hypothetical protein [Dissulfurispiraceae bacterium]
MSDTEYFAEMAVLLELNGRDSRRKLDLFPEDTRYFAMLAGSIVGAELAQRLEEVPEAVAQQSSAFTQRLLELTSPGDDGTFQGILETYLIETLKDELRFCCANCKKFKTCLALDSEEVGDLFRQRTLGDESAELKRRLSDIVNDAFVRTPYLAVEIADELCDRFIHQYTARDIGGVFGRYADIAASLQAQYGVNYRKIQDEMIRINMDFAAGRIKP